MRRIALVLALLLTAGLGAQTIGFQNHNPGNIRAWHPAQWRGCTGVDKYQHLQFKTDLDGLKAMRRILRAYYYRHHINTVSGIVNRWVARPKTHAHTIAIRSYLLGVAQQAGVEANTPLYLTSDVMMIRVMKGIVYAENGMDPLPDSLYEQAFP